MQGSSQICIAMCDVSMIATAVIPLLPHVTILYIRTFIFIDSINSLIQCCSCSSSVGGRLASARIIRCLCTRRLFFIARSLRIESYQHHYEMLVVFVYDCHLYCMTRVTIQTFLVCRYKILKLLDQNLGSFVTHSNNCLLSTSSDIRSLPPAPWHVDWCLRCRLLGTAQVTDSPDDTLTTPHSFLTGCKIFSQSNFKFSMCSSVGVLSIPLRSAVCDLVSSLKEKF